MRGTTSTSDERMSANTCIRRVDAEGRFNYRWAHLLSNGDAHVAGLNERPAERGLVGSLVADDGDADGSDRRVDLSAQSWSLVELGELRVAAGKGVGASTARGGPVLRSSNNGAVRRPAA